MSSPVSDTQDRRCNYTRKIEALSRNHSCRGKAINFIYSEDVYITLIIQYAMYMERLWPVWLYHILPRISGGIYWTKVMFWFSLQVVSKALLILRKTQREIMINVHRYSVKYSLFVPHFNWTLIFSRDFRKLLKYQTLWKSYQWQPSCSMRMDGRRDRRTDRHDTANNRFSQFCENA